MSVMRRRMMLQQPYTQLEYLITMRSRFIIPDMYVRYTDVFTVAVKASGYLFSFSTPGGLNCSLTDFWLNWFNRSGTMLPSRTGIVDPFQIHENQVENLTTGKTATIANTPTDEEAGPVSVGMLSGNQVKIGACSIERDGALILDMIPVVDLNGTPCMFERVTRTYIYAEGDGTVEAGPVMEG